MLQQIRVLIVDNQQPTRKGLNALLEQCQEIVVIGQATDGQEAVHLVAETHPDVVLMGIQMPEMKELEAIRWIRRHWKDVRVIVLTVYPSNRDKALRAGADAFLIKGCSLKVLLGAILTADNGNRRVRSILNNQHETATS